MSADLELKLTRLLQVKTADVQRTCYYTVITHRAYVVCYFRDVYPFTYFIIAGGVAQW